MKSLIMANQRSVKMSVCRRCRLQDASVVSRKEWFCNECFQKFVSAKQRKQMMCEPYFQNIFKVLYQDKIRSAEEAALQNQQSKVLVPLSFGSSSLVMLDILNETLTEQKQTQRGNTGFQIDVLICLKAGDDRDTYQKIVKELHEERYAMNHEKLKFHFISEESFYDGELRTILLDNQDFVSKSIKGQLDLSQNSTVEKLLAQCPDKSSRKDLDTFIQRHLIKKYAYQHNHKAILWGHSMTKLADETISLIVKGRGSQISPLLSDTELNPLYENKFKNMFPLKDVLLSEIDAYCFTKGLEGFLVGYVAQDTLLVNKIGDNKQPTKMVKQLSINEIARGYFDDVEADYSNVISTVVRTAYKLAEPKSTCSEPCSICQTKIHSDASRWLRAITVNDSHPIENDEEVGLFAKWRDSELGNEVIEYMKLKDRAFQDGVDAPLCYGCMINLNRMRNRNVLWPQNDEEELQTVLNEFVLADDGE